LDTSRLSQGEKIVAVSSGLLVLLSFFPLWAKYEYDVGAFSDSERYSAWSDAFSFLTKLAVLLALAALVLIIVRAVGKDVNLPVPAGLVYVALGGLTTLLLLIVVITGPKDLGDLGVTGLTGAQLDLLDAGFEISRGFMLFVGTALAAGILVGGYLHMQGETTGPSSPTTPPATPPPAS